MLNPARGFWLPGLFAVGLAALAIRLNAFAWAPFVTDLLERGGAPGRIAELVLAVTLWVGVVAAIRLRRTHVERSVIAEVRSHVGRQVLADGISDVDQWLVRAVHEPPYATSLLRRRFDLLRRAPRGTPTETAAFVLANQSALDANYSETSYGPLRALVWSLPTLGFLGTASEMGRAVSGLGNAVARTDDYQSLRNLLVNRVVPPLADAFDITLFALSASVLCYFLVAVTHAREESTLLDADSASLEVLALTATSAPDGAVISPPQVHGDIDALVTQVGQANRALAASNELIGRVATTGGLVQIADLLRSIDRRLGEIGDDMGHDLVIRRLDGRPSTGQLDGHY